MQERQRLDEENRSLRKALARRNDARARASRACPRLPIWRRRDERGANTRVNSCAQLGAARRLQWLVARVEKLDDEAKERDDYARPSSEDSSRNTRRWIRWTNTREEAARGLSPRAPARRREDVDGRGVRVRTGSRSARASLDSAVAFLKSGGKGGWVTGSDGRSAHGAPRHRLSAPREGGGEPRAGSVRARRRGRLRLRLGSNRRRGGCRGGG